MFGIGLVLLVVGLILPHPQVAKIGAVLMLVDLLLGALFIAGHR